MFFSKDPMLWEVNCFLFYPRPQIRNELEQHMSCNLTEYKEFIDNEMLLILGQMDKATLIFDHVYLVRTFFFCALVTLCYFEVFLCRFYIVFLTFLPC